MNVPDEGYSRNPPCALNSISTILMQKSMRFFIPRIIIVQEW